MQNLSSQSIQNVGASIHLQDITLTEPQSLFVHKSKESQRSMTREETTDAWTFKPTLDHFPMESSCWKTQKAEKMTPVRILLRMQWSNWWNFGRK